LLLEDFFIDHKRSTLGVPQSFVSKYESGERRLDVVELGHVAGALRVSLREMLEQLEL